MTQTISKITALGQCILAFVLISAAAVGAESLEIPDQRYPELARMKAVLDCTCPCGLSLAHCEKEDADCAQRPALLAKLEGLIDDGKREMEVVVGFMGAMHPAKEQLMEARLQSRHAILFFYQEGCGECEEVKDVLKKGVQIWGDKVKVSQVDINKKTNDKIRLEFRIFSTPTILVMAPNGVVVREFRQNITIERLESAFVTPTMAQILRGLQDRRVIFLTVQAADWENASSVTKTVSTVGEILRNSVRVLQVDPTRREEKPLLKMLNLDNRQKQPLTYVVSQSGRVGGRFEGPVSRKDLFLAFQKVLAARTGCGGSGSGPGGNTCK